LEDELKTRVRALSLEGAVLVPGRIEPSAWLARADVFAHTSRWEGFGIVLLEAMLARLPIVATRASAIPEIVVEGETGLLAEPGDAAAIARGLDELLAAADLRARFGEAGRRRALSEFSVARMVERTIAVYEGAAS
jgi:glycosyltransferase involved in cell wall biosynthesis